MSPLFILLIGLAVVVFCIVFLRLHAFVALVLAALAVGVLTSTESLHQYALSIGMSGDEADVFASQTLTKRLVTAFGNTCAKIGILIAMASIIGTALLKSGSAERIVRGAIQLFGRERMPQAFLSGSFLLAIPVFFDTVFYLMIPIVKSFGIRNVKKYSLYLMCVIAGGVMAHSLVPPTPGPLFVAEELGVDLGVMIMMGLLVGIVTIIAGYFYALWASDKWHLPMRDSEDTSLEELDAYANQKAEDLPPLLMALIPILLPVLLIAGNTIARSSLEGSHPLVKFLAVVGDSNLALTFAALIALVLLFKYADKSKFKRYTQQALSSAGVIILITAAGGALGGMLQQSGITQTVQSFAGNFQLAVLPLAFFASALIRTAQGSATVAMITTIGILSGLAATGALDFHPVYIALAIGCGSKIFPWMNDSGFWIVTKMSGMTEKESIRYFSFLLTTMGFAGLVATMVLAKVLPLT